MFEKVISFFRPKNPNKWIGLVLVSLALAIIIIDGTVLNVSQRDIITDIGLNSSQSKILEGFKGLQWATTLFSLIVAAFTIWGGRIADKYGKKRIFLIGAVLFAVGSLITSLSYYWGISRPFLGVDFYGMYWLLIGWSVIEGIGAAMMMPATIALLVSNFEGKERGAAFAVWGATAGFSSALGPLLGGYFTTYHNWSWAFLINVFVVLVLLLLSGHIVDKSERQKSLKIDNTSVALSGLGIAAVTYGLIESSTYGWWQAKEVWQSFWGQTYNLPFNLSVTPYAIALGLVLLILFVFRQHNLALQKRSALVDLSLFQSRQYSIGLLALIFFSIAFSSLIFALPFFLQVILGFDAFHSGLAFLPFSLGSLVVGIAVGILSQKIHLPARPMVIAGIALTGVGLLWVGLGLSLTWDVWSFVLPFIIMGIGGGLSQAQLGNLTLSDIEVRKSGEASGVQSAVRQLGQTLSTAVIGSIFVTVLASSVATNINNLPTTGLPQQVKDQYISVFSDTKAIYGLAPDEQKAACESEELEKRRNCVPEFVAKEVRQSIVESSKSAMMAGAAAAGLALLFAFFFHDSRKASGEASAAQH